MRLAKKYRLPMLLEKLDNLTDELNMVSGKLCILKEEICKELKEVNSD